MNLLWKQFQLMNSWPKRLKHLQNLHRSIQYVHRSWIWKRSKNLLIRVSFKLFRMSSMFLTWHNYWNLLWSCESLKLGAVLVKLKIAFWLFIIKFPSAYKACNLAETSMAEIAQVLNLQWFCKRTHDCKFPLYKISATELHPCSSESLVFLI
jgi:hypothetical protein